MDSAFELYRKIKSKSITLGVIGIGYVGSALIKYASEENIDIIGFTRSREKADYLNKTNKGLYSITTDISILAECDVICVCVPTPVNPDKTPDLNPVEESIRKIAKHLRPGQLIIIESSVAPGTTRNFILPILLISGLKAGKDFFLSYSPERVDPGNEKYSIKNTPKIVSGIDKFSLRLVSEFYKIFVDKVVPVSSPETAEMTKILENTYRLVNISLINELTGYTKSSGINIWEVIEAASTKPFGFLPHFPGPGIGGHCIPVDPFYLLDDARKKGIPLKIVREAGKINDKQPRKMAKKAEDILYKTNGTHKARVILIGIAYKPDIDDIRESPALKIWEYLEKKGMDVDYHDPYVPRINGFSSIKLSIEALQAYDLIIIVTNHKSIDYQKLLKVNRPILDTRHVFADIKSNVYVP